MNRTNINKAKKTNQCGPIYYPGIEAVESNNGVCLRHPLRLDKNTKTTDWIASWIWLNKNRYPAYQTTPCTTFCSRENHYYGVALLRKEFTITGIPAQVKAWVSGDRKYRLYINGHLAGRGPAEAGGDWGNKNALDWWYYDSYDFTPYFQQGTNVLSAEVILQNDVQADYSMGHGGFIFEAKVSTTDKNVVVLKTDDTWRGIKGEAFVECNRYDARHEPIGWRQAGFDDKTWPFVDSLGIPPNGLWKLIPSEIPPLMETDIHPVSMVMLAEKCKSRIINPSALLKPNEENTVISAGCDINFLVKFEKEVVGRIYFSVEGVEGVEINFEYEEILGHAHHREIYILRDGQQCFESFRLNSFQYLRVTIKKMAGLINIREISCHFSSYPVSYCGKFSCSDELLNKIWEVGRWTNQLCMQSYHLDSPVHQECLGCTGDYMIEALINYCTFGDSKLIRQDLLKTSYYLEQNNGVMFHTSYSLLWLQMLMEYYDHTGDKKLLQLLSSTVWKLMELFASYRGTSGLITEAPNYMFMDWLSVDDFELHHPPCVIGQGYMTAFYYKALHNAALLADILREPNRARIFRQTANEVTEAFNNELWVADKGLYCDGRPFQTSVPPSRFLAEDIDGCYFSQHTNVLAVAYGLAPPEKHVAIMQRVLNDSSLPETQPYFMHFVFAAVTQADLFDKYGLQLIRRWKRLLDEHDSSWKEGWDMGDYSHAWSGTPTYQLMSQVLGITPIEPGFKKINIKPSMGDLQRVTGIMPTPYGEIKVEWQYENSKLLGILKLPADTTVDIELRKKDKLRPVVKLNNFIIWKRRAIRSFEGNLLNIFETEKYIKLTIQVTSEFKEFKIELN